MEVQSYSQMSKPLFPSTIMCLEELGVKSSWTDHNMRITGRTTPVCNVASRKGTKVQCGKMSPKKSSKWDYVVTTRTMGEFNVCVETWC
jgi:hypothetical protein